MPIKNALNTKNHDVILTTLTVLQLILRMGKKLSTNYCFICARLNRNHETITRQSRLKWVLSRTFRECIMTLNCFPQHQLPSMHLQTNTLTHTKPQNWQRCCFFASNTGAIVFNNSEVVPFKQPRFPSFASFTRFIIIYASQTTPSSEKIENDGCCSWLLPKRYLPPASGWVPTQKMPSKNRYCAKSHWKLIHTQSHTLLED